MDYPRLPKPIKGKCWSFEDICDTCYTKTVLRLAGSFNLKKLAQARFKCIPVRVPSSNSPTGSNLWLVAISKVQKKDLLWGLPLCIQRSCWNARRFLVMSPCTVCQSDLDFLAAAIFFLRQNLTCISLTMSKTKVQSERRFAIVILKPQPRLQRNFHILPLNQLPSSTSNIKS